MTDPDADITALLHAAERGDRDALDRAFALVYQHLRGLAHAQRQRDRQDTLSTTALVHETYIKLVHSPQLTLSSRAHFFNLAARAMRQVMLDRARAIAASKRSDGQVRVTLDAELDAAAPEAPALSAELLDLDRALTRLTDADERLADLVSLRLFAGLEFPEIAVLRGVSERTVLRDWRRIRAFLVTELGM